MKLFSNINISSIKNFIHTFNAFKSPIPNWNFLITNASSSVLPINKIFIFYRLRYQIYHI